MANDGAWLGKTGRAKRAEDSNFGDGFMIDNIGFIHFLLQKGRTPQQVKEKLREHEMPITNDACKYAVGRMPWAKDKKEEYLNEYYGREK